MKTIICVMFMAVAAASSFGQAQDDGQELIDKFFDVYKNKGHEYALKYAFSTNKWIPTEGNEMDAVGLKLSKQVAAMGDYLGHEEIRSRSVGSRFRISTYFVYYQRDPLRFLFEMYKTDKGWEITSVEFDSNFEKELEESMKLTDK